MKSRMLNIKSPTAFEIDAILETYEGMLSMMDARNPSEHLDVVLKQIAFWEAEFAKAVEG